MEKFLKIALSILLLTSCGATMEAAILDYDDVPLNLQLKGQKPGHVEWLDPLDLPDVTLQVSEDYVRLKIYGWDTTLSYYDVEVLDYNDDIVVSTSIPGSGTSYVYLPSDAYGNYTVNIAASNGNEYTGTFYVP